MSVECFFKNKHKKCIPNVNYVQVKNSLPKSKQKFYNIKNIVWASVLNLNINSFINIIYSFKMYLMVERTI